jgi:NAD(P)H-hydrate epimerase
MAGAAALVGASALRSGAGLVRVASPAEVQPSVAVLEPSYMTWPLAQDEHGRIDFARAQADLEHWIGASDVVAAGPGLGRSEGLDRLVAWLIERVAGPLVLDADALNALAGRTSLLKGRPHVTIVTPHPGELARLVGALAADVQVNRTAHAVALAGDASGPLVVVLKGQGTIVTDGARQYVNDTGNPGMATGGSGDCLTGVIAALLGQKLEPFDAAVLGVYVHGLAGDIARDQSGMVGMIAGDIVDSLPDAFFHLGEAE